jgi:hypothetical protein
VVRRLASLALLAALAVSCKRDTPADSHAASETPIPAPATLIAEGTLRDPDAFWGRLRKGGGAPLATMHEAAAGAILAWAGVDPAVAPLVSGGVPFHVALGDAPEGMAFAIAMKLRDFESVRSALVEGETARFGREDLDGMIRLVPREDPQPRFAMAVSWTGYLVLASTAADLGTLGAYASRTLPTKAATASSFELRMDPAALVRAGKAAPDFAAKATTFLAAAARGALPPEVDASAFAACFTAGIQDTAAAAGDLAEARLEADADEARLEMVAILVPRPGGNRARHRLGRMHTVNPAALFEAPRDALAALFWSDTPEIRAEDAGQLAPCLGKALAPILGFGGDAKLADLAASWATGRGDWETASFVAKPGEAGLVLRAPVADGASMSGAVRDFVDLASQPAFTDAIERLLPLRAGGVETVDVPRVGKAQVLTFPSHSPASKADTDPSPATTGLAPPGIAWVVDAKEIDVGLGQSPKELLGHARPAVAFRSSAPIARALGALGNEVSFAAIVVPPGCCAGPGPASDPLTFGWGHRGEHGRASLALGDELLGQIIARVTAP